ncbi:U3 small nucleolar RNA-associated protein 4 homolog [Thrips palmi]|uniref:U3 small nucleolar RNA-associated protein 4 homolog n=1 Tax=Thrips palmi TaxID=161013 RepID=A0A6P8ZWQ4_THRPL|nr:U3 small nucleolar RNA-associated protein 4 homolog [Thrips palmi]
MSEARVHRVRFYNVEPKAIHCMAYDPDHRKIALSRADSSVEIWNLYHTAYLEQVIPGCPQGSVEALAWCKSRLFSTGIHARVVEHDLKTLQTKYSLSVTAGPAWCLGLNRQKTFLAVGTEDGYINIFSVTSDNLQYEKLMDKQEGRILCLSWDSSGDFIATGSVDAVRVWNVHTGHALHKMTTGRNEAKKETIVWCLAVTDDFTIISGDSRGKISFWNGHSGINTETYQTHTADVLCLALSEDQSTLYCSGVDPVIATFTRISIRSSVQQNGLTGAMGTKITPSQRTQWCRSAKGRIHDHDVRAMVACHGKLCSGGIDSYLAISRPPKVLVKHPPIPQAPCVLVCPQSRCLLLRNTSSLEVWKLGESEKRQNTIVENGSRNRQRRQSGDGGSAQSRQTFKQNGASSSGPLRLAQNPVKILELKSRNDEHIVCSALSSDSKWLAYSTDSLIRIYTLSYEDDNNPTLEKVAPLPEECVPSHRMRFSSNNCRLVTVTLDGQIVIFDLTANEPSVTFSCALDTTNYLKGAVHLLEISEDQNLIITGDHESNIVVWKENKVHCSLPHYTCGPSALSISSCSKYIVVVYIDNLIVEYSIQDKKLTDFSRKLQHKLPNEWMARPFPVLNVCYDPRDSNKIIMHDDSTICVLDKLKKMAHPSAKIPRLDLTLKKYGAKEEGTHPGTSSADHTFRLIKCYKHLVFFGWLAGDEVVAVEVEPLHLLKQLPPALYKKMFGV